jgi:hypothetical protein
MLAMRALILPSPGVDRDPNHFAPDGLGMCAVPDHRETTAVVMHVFRTFASKLGQIGLLPKFRGTAKLISAGQTVLIGKMSYELVTCGNSGSINFLWQHDYPM